MCKLKSFCSKKKTIKEKLKADNWAVTMRSNMSWSKTI